MGGERGILMSHYMPSIFLCCLTDHTCCWEKSPISQLSLFYKKDQGLRCSFTNGIVWVLHLSDLWEQHPLYFQRRCNWHYLLLMHIKGSEQSHSEGKSKLKRPIVYSYHFTNSHVSKSHRLSSLYLSGRPDDLNIISYTRNVAERRVSGFWPVLGLPMHLAYFFIRIFNKGEVATSESVNAFHNHSYSFLF